MRTISIRDDVEQVVLQYVRALPEIFTEFDIASVELQEYAVDGAVFAADIVFVESDDYELVIGEVWVDFDLMLEVEVYSEEDELELTKDDIVEDYLI